MNTPYSPKTIWLQEIDEALRAYRQEASKSMLLKFSEKEKVNEGMHHDEQHPRRICIVNNSQIITMTVQNFLTDLGYEAFAVTVTELREYLEGHAETLDLAIIPRSIEKALLREMHRRHPETMLIMLNDNGSSLPTDEVLTYGVYAFLNMPIHFNELEVLLVRLAQYSHSQSATEEKLT